MRSLYSILFFLLLSFVSSAAPIKARFSTPWRYFTTWNLLRLPQAGDAIDIPFGVTVTIDSKVVLSGSVDITIEGTLIFDGNASMLDLEKGTIAVNGGSIIGLAEDASQKIRVANNIIFSSNQPDISGFFISGVNSFVKIPSVLPVTFSEFSLARKNGDVMVHWSTETEQNTSVFEVERSLDGTNWSTISKVKAAGNATSRSSYSYTDRNPSSQALYYRIRQVDEDGTFTYTSVKSITMDKVSSGLKIASASNRLILQFPQMVKSGVSVRIISLNGQVLKEQRIEQAVGQVSVSTHLKGNYIVSVSNGLDVQMGQQVIL